MASSYKFCVIATGEFDIYAAKERANEWDYAAGHAVAQNAVTEFELNTNAVHFEHIKDQNVLTNAIADKNITYAKIQNVPSNSLLVRNSNDAGTLTDFRVNNKQILIGNGMGFNAKELSGDVLMENNGEVLIKPNAITRDKIHNREVITLNKVYIYFNKLHF